jgi:hypothetical protein
MKRALIVVFGLLVLLGTQSSAAPVMGSAFGTLTTARTLGQGVGNLGAGVGIADKTTAFGVFTYGLSRYTDGQLKLGLWDEGSKSNTKMTFGADFKWQFWTAGPGRREPFDLSFGGAFEYVDKGSYSVFQFGGNVIGSYPFALGNGSTLSPYGRFGIRIESASGSRDSGSNLKLGLNAGACWKATSTVSLYGEFQFDGNDGVFLGLDINVM